MSADPGQPNAPTRRLDSASIIWEKAISPSWWRNAHVLAASPLEFTTALGRLSGPGLPPVLYLASNSLTAFWESGLGRDLNARMPQNRSLSEADLISRIEYQVHFRAKNLRIFNVSDPAARRSIGSKTVACFSAEHRIAREWATRLHEAGADGILYESTRHKGQCLALFATQSSKRSLHASKKIGTAYDNPALLASLFAEGISLVGG